MSPTRGCSHGMGKAAPEIEFLPPSSPAAKKSDSEAIGFQAGPMMGGKPLQPKEDMGEATVKIPSTSKCLIFVVDLQNAKSLDDEPKKLNEMQEDITDALGVSTQDQQLQVVFAGYHGPARAAIDNDDQLNDFFNTFVGVSSEPRRSSAVQERQSRHTGSRRSELMQQTAEEMNTTRSELMRLRLGGIITKIQMRKYIRKHHEARTALDELEVKHQELIQQYEHLEKMIPHKIRAAVEDASAKLETKLNQEHEKQTRDLVARMNKETENKLRIKDREITNKQQTIEKQKEQIREISLEREEVNRSLEEQKRKTAFAFEQLDLARLQREQDLEKAALAGADDANNAASMKDRLEKLERRFTRASQILLENGLEVPGEDDAESSNTPTDKFTYVWRVPGMEGKLDSYLPGRSLQSREFHLGDIEDPFQLEFYPNGVEMSSTGMSSLRLRAPNYTRIDWSVLIGHNRYVGRRQDEFNEDNWWSRQGILWANFSASSVVRDELNPKDGALIIRVQAMRIDRLPGYQTNLKIPAKNLPRLRLSLAPQPVLQMSAGDAQVLIGQLEIKYKGESVLDPVLLNFVCEYINKQRPNSRAQSRGGDGGFGKLEDAFGMKDLGSLFQVRNPKARDRGNDLTQLPNPVGRLGQSVLRPCTSEGSLGALNPKGKVGAGPNVTLSMTHPGSTVRNSVGRRGLPPTR